MNETNFNLLITDNDIVSPISKESLDHIGCNLIRSTESPLDIQLKVLNNSPDAVILSSKTKYLPELCQNLKSIQSHINIAFYCKEDSKNIDTDLMPCIDTVFNEQAFKTQLCEFIYTGKMQKVNDNINETQINNKKFDIARKISNILFMLCITPNYNGYSYISEAVKTVIENNISSGITKTIYPIVAKNMSTTVSAVERNIRTVIRRSWGKANSRNKIDIFGLYAADKSHVPTNSEFIFVIANKIKCEIN